MTPAPKTVLEGRRWLRPLLLGTLSLFGALALLWGIHLLRQQDPFLRRFQPMPPDLQGVALHIQSPALVLRDGARLLAQVQAERLDLTQNRTEWKARGLRKVVLYDEAGRPFAYATAQEMLYNQPLQRLHLGGQPQVRFVRHPLSQGELQVQLAWLTWDARRQILETRQPVQFQWAEGNGTAQAIVWDVAQERITVEAGDFRVRTTLQEPNRQREVQVRFARSVIEREVQRGEGLEFRDGDTFAYAPQAEVYDRRKYAKATGVLRLEDPRVDIQGRQLEVWYGENQKRARLTQEVRLLIKPQTREAIPPEDEDEIERAKRYPIDATADEIEYHYRRKVAYLRGNIRAVQNLPDGITRTLTADEAEYNQREETLILRGNVVIDEPKRMRLKTDLAIVSLKEGEEKIQLPNGTSGVIYYTEEEEEPSGTPP